MWATPVAEEPYLQTALDWEQVRGVEDMVAKVQHHQLPQGQQIVAVVAVVVLHQLVQLKVLLVVPVWLFSVGEHQLQELIHNQANVVKKQHT
jgi:hypothetical protein